MKKLCLTLLALIAAPLAVAFDLGELSVRSVPGENLQAIIPIIDPPENLQELKVELATDKEFSNALLSYTPEHCLLEMTIHKTSANKAHIRLISEQPLQEEVLQFLLVLQNAQSRLVREYVIIQEGELYATHAQPTIVQLATASQEKRHRPLSAPVIALGEKANRFLEVKNKAEVRDVNNYRVKYGDNLWYIAQKLHKHYRSATFYQVLAGLYQANQQAFMEGDINKLWAGTTLDLPSVSQLKELTPQQATDFVEEKLARAQKNTGTSSTAVVTNKDTLHILAPKTALELSSEQAKLGQDLALVNESLAQVQRENEGLHKRVQALQAQIDTLKEMIALRKQKTNSLTLQTEDFVAPQAAAGVKLGITGWSAVNQLWQEINRNEWMYYLVISLGILAILLVIMSAYIVYRISKADKAVEAAIKTIPETKKPAKKSREDKPKKTANAEQDDNDKTAVKLELAQAYWNLSDTENAKNILQDILKTGNTAQRQAAQALLDKME